MRENVRTDLAIEEKELLSEENPSLEDIETVEDTPYENVLVTRVKIKKGQESLLRKKEGTYITIEFPKDFKGVNDLTEILSDVLSKEIKKLIPKDISSTLVAGLGNKNITSDALGPKVVDSILVTRHLKEYMPDEIDSRLSSVSALSPGVLGITGIETAEILKGICKKVKPDLVILIDALCSRKIDRVNRTIQVSDTGISPGAGVGNRRVEINSALLSAPVISIGVPTVVDAATIAGDTILIVTENLKENAKENEPLYKMLSVLTEEDNMPIIKSALSPVIGDFVVTPKEVDETIIRLSKIISNGINLALHKGITLKELELFN